MCVINCNRKYICEKFQPRNINSFYFETLKSILLSVSL